MRAFTRRLGAVLALVVVLSALLVPAVSAAPEGAQVVYWVRPGDNLYGIAARFGVSAASIAAANNLRNWNFIYVGQPLVIPGGYSSPPAPGGSPVYYTVRPGDTLGTIAARFGTTYWALGQLNGLTNLNCIYVGQVLLISSGAACSFGCPPAPPPSPAPPSGAIGPWLGDYFSSTDLSGTAVVERQDATVDFSWGWNPPAAGMPNFNWSSRWTTTQSLAGGTYRAWVSVDDGVRVYVDGTKIIDSWVVQAEAPYQQDFIVVPGNHTITIEYFQAQGVSAIHFKLWRVG